MAEPYDPIFETGAVRPTRNLPSHFTKALRKEAEEGIPAAMLMMGKSSLDLDDGLGWLGRAGEAGLAEAFGIGGLHLLRAGRTAEAVAWFTKGEPLEEPESLYRLGLFAWAGDGVPQDSVRAITLLNRAAEAGHPEAPKALAKLRDETHGNARPDGGEAMQLLKVVPRLQEPEVMLAMGKALMVGDKVAVNPVRGMELIQNAASAGFAEAHHELFRIHSQGGPKYRDLDAAQRHLQVAAEQGYPDAMLELGLQLRSRQPEQAALWLRKATDFELPEAMFALGEMSYEGKGMAQDKLHALRWFRSAGKRGHKGAASRAAHILHRGDGVLPNKAEAQTWADLAGERLGFWSFLGPKA